MANTKDIKKNVVEASAAGVKDNKDNVSTSTGSLSKEQEDIVARTVVIKEKGEANPYKISDSTVQLNIDVDNPDSPVLTGVIASEVLINDTELDFVRTWRFTIKDIVIKEISLDSASGNIIYKFSAGEYSIEA